MNTSAAAAASDAGQGVVFVLFGPTGDLARRLLFPALWRAHRHQRISGDWQLVGTARSPTTDDDLRHEARHGIEEHAGGAVDEDTWRDFASRLTYCRADLVNGSGDELARVLAKIRPAGERSGRRLVHYLATPSPTFGPVTGRLDALGLLTDATVVYEKPFGLDLDSYRDLERTVERHLAPERTFRLDHFLGKAALRRLVEVRRAVPLLEELWSAEYVERVQIDVPETLTVGDRAGFYEETGALRDVVTTHLFQVLSVVAMDLSDADTDLAAARSGVFDAMRPLRRNAVAYGQYDGYRTSAGVSDSSTTETLAAAVVHVDNPRWGGVPFQLRHGKAMTESRQRLALTFSPLAADWLRSAGFVLDGDEYVVHLDAPDVPHPFAALPDVQESEVPTDHEQLLLEMLTGDHSWFTQPSALSHTWKRIADLLTDPPSVDPYPTQSWGPASATELIAPFVWTIGP